MNERIRELAEQAGASRRAGVGGLVFRDAELKKFAELIVRECMEQVWYTREDGINGNISEVIKERMKQHFGVEE